MARINTRSKKDQIFTHEGAKAVHITPQLQLRRSVLACMLWEDQFYEDGKTIADRISELCSQVTPEVIAETAIEARYKQHLRHVPLLLLRNLVKYGKGKIVQDTIEQVISRADELSEFVAIYWQDKKNKKMLPAQMKKGLARAFTKFNEYSLAKYNRESEVKLRDVLFLCHAKPKDDEQGALWKKLIAGELAIPDTWETQLSGGADKKETFERLISEGKLGYFALLRNLRNMQQAGCDAKLVSDAIRARRNGADKILPFRFIAASRAAPQFEPALDNSLLSTISELPELSGTTIVLVDISGSMDDKLSAKSDMTRADAAAALASVINGTVRVFSFTTDVREVAPRKGMSGVDSILKSQRHGSTNLGHALNVVQKYPHDRIIVITDEQSHDRVGDPVVEKAYMINVASYRNGVGYGKWTHIDGFSENVIRWIIEHEAQD